MAKCYYADVQKRMMSDIARKLKLDDMVFMDEGNMFIVSDNQRLVNIIPKQKFFLNDNAIALGPDMQYMHDAMHSLMERLMEFEKKAEKAVSLGITEHADDGRSFVFYRRGDNEVTLEEKLVKPLKPYIGMVKMIDEVNPVFFYDKDGVLICIIAPTRYKRGC